VHLSSRNSRSEYPGASPAPRTPRSIHPRFLNTIIQPAGDAQEVAAFQQSLVGLVERDYIVMGLEAFHPREIEKFDKMASQELLASLGDWFKFDAADPHWTLAKGDIKKERIPIILSTASGRQKADKILRERGYQWWRHKK
jgi:hypothetical protein